MVTINYIPEKHQCLIKCDESETHWPKIRLLFSEISSEFISGKNEIEIPWHAFIANIKTVNYLINKYKIKLDIPESTIELIKDSQKKRKAYLELDKAQGINESEIQSSLNSLGFLRELTNEQIRNVSKLTRLNAGATFSVPGAGKTTEAISFYWLKRNSKSKLIVICPKNAFSSWEEQFDKCLGENKVKLLRLTGGSTVIKEQLESNAEGYLISYQQFILVVTLISAFLHKYETFLFLDESHRIKGGIYSMVGQSVQEISYLPIGKLILSGTPMPNKIIDLVPQFKYLFPEQNPVNESNIIELIQPIFVRTTKAELKLPPIEIYLTIIPFTEPQRKLYDLVRSEEYRRIQGITRVDKEFLRRLGRSYMRLLQISSNPSLLARQMTGFTDELRETIEFGDSAKIDYTVFKARQLAKEGKKVIIWSGFVENVELITRKLVDLGARYIHGGVEAGSDEEENTREGIIKNFHENPNAYVLVANPAACSESISLHTVCHYAIYVDRDYNAARYLQSQDRIHRLGLEEGQLTTIEILHTPDSIDERINSRLKNKIQRMADVLNDHSLHVEEEIIDLDETGFNQSDAVDLLEHLKD